MASNQKSGKSTLGGSLSIWSGALWVLSMVFGIYLLWALVGTFMPPADRPGYGPLAVLIVMSLPMTAVGVIAIVGGVYARQRRHWRWALAGAICSLGIFPIGIPALVLVLRSKKDFVRGQPTS